MKIQFTIEHGIISHLNVDAFALDEILFFIIRIIGASSNTINHTKNKLSFIRIFETSTSDVHDHGSLLCLRMISLTVIVYQRVYFEIWSHVENQTEKSNYMIYLLFIWSQWSSISWQNTEWRQFRVQIETAFFRRRQISLQKRARWSGGDILPPPVV